MDADTCKAFFKEVKIDTYLQRWRDLDFRVQKAFNDYANSVNMLFFATGGDPHRVRERVLSAIEMYGRAIPKEGNLISQLRLGREAKTYLADVNTLYDVANEYLVKNESYDAETLMLLHRVLNKATSGDWAK